MRPRIKCQLKVLLIVGICIVFYNEFFVYEIQSYGWPKLECRDRNTCVKLLLVADPQILGEQSVGSALKYLFNFDSDRYLMKTYGRVVADFTPNAVIFLGDIMDEGTIATSEEFHRYIKRLSDIFPTEYPIKHVWLPGDNDIGGENEPVYPQKMNRFSKSFSQPDVISVGDVDIYKLNLITRNYPSVPEDFTVQFNRTAIIVSHMPLLLSPGPFSEAVLSKFQPSVIFSAHKHTALHLETTSDAKFVGKVSKLTPQDEENVIDIEFDRSAFNEFLVPTCSYRMGVPDMGYGVAFIDATGLQYSVFWSPGRFELLKIYLCYSIVFLMYVFATLFIKLCLTLNDYKKNPSRNGYIKVKNNH